jgi:hypothetical protein
MHAISDNHPAESDAGRCAGQSRSGTPPRRLASARSSSARSSDARGPRWPGRWIPASKSGELAALLIRCYRSLFVLTGGEPEAMSHWMTTFNLHTGGVPREQIKQVQGLVTGDANISTRCAASCEPHLAGRSATAQRRPTRPSMQCPLKGTLLRLVESQEQVATNAVVDSGRRAGRARTDSSSAPSQPSRAGTEQRPLPAAGAVPLSAAGKHGSRFGTRFEPSIFYGSREEHTVLAEGAFYRFWFWHGMSRPPRANRFRTQHTVFKAGYRTATQAFACRIRRSTRIRRRPCATRAAIGETQALGARRMRAAGMRSVRVRFGARSGVRPERGDCFIRMLCRHRKRILRREEWACTTGPERVVFYHPARRATREFSHDLYLVNGAFPTPAA